ncbi:unnamed protein product [Linum tenue]|uniref:Uncharacterized protein n=1 Tax=Linum tenue TaxID=586396 RepID=A0AAV0Q2R6_9ROSI|nr:unnamed protein product [Linum tenue]
MEKSIMMKSALFFALLIFVAGLEMRFAEGRGPIVSGKCNKVEECEHTPFCDGCKVCSCLEHTCGCAPTCCDANTSDNNVTATTSTLHHTINSSSLAH